MPGGAEVGLRMATACVVVVLLVGRLTCDDVLELDKVSLEARQGITWFAVGAYLLPVLGMPFHLTMLCVWPLLAVELLILLARLIVGGDLEQGVLILTGVTCAWASIALLSRTCGREACVSFGRYLTGRERGAVCASLFDATFEAACVLDRHLRIVASTLEMNALLGRDCVGAKLTDFMHPKDARAFEIFGKGPTSMSAQLIQTTLHVQPVAPNYISAVDCEAYLVSHELGQGVLVAGIRVVETHFGSPSADDDGIHTGDQLRLTDVRPGIADAKAQSHGAGPASASTAGETPATAPGRAYHRHCLLPGAVVLLLDGEQVRAEDLQAGDPVLATSNGSARVALARTVLPVHQYDVVAIHLEGCDGPGAAMTRDHMVVCRNAATEERGPFPWGCGEAGELRMGMEVMGVEGAHRVHSVQVDQVDTCVIEVMLEDVCSFLFVGQGHGPAIAAFSSLETQLDCNLTVKNTFLALALQPHEPSLRRCQSDPGLRALAQMHRPQTEPAAAAAPPAPSAPAPASCCDGIAEVWYEDGHALWQDGYVPSVSGDSSPRAQRSGGSLVSMSSASSTRADDFVRVMLAGPHTSGVVSFDQIRDSCTDQDGALLSLGSAFHKEDALQDCRVCWHHHRYPGSCARGVLCDRCHHPHEELPRRGGRPRRKRTVEPANWLLCRMAELAV